MNYYDLYSLRIRQKLKREEEICAREADVIENKWVAGAGRRVQRKLKALKQKA